MLNFLKAILFKDPQVRFNDLSYTNKNENHFIDGPMNEWYKNIGASTNEVFSLHKILRNQRNYPVNKSFPCLLTDTFVDTIQNGYLGQLDEKFFSLSEAVYNDLTSRLPYLKDAASKIFSFMGALPDPLTIPPPSTEVTRLANGLPGDTPEDFNDVVYTLVSYFLDNFMTLGEDYFPKIASDGNPGIPDVVVHDGLLLRKDNNPYAVRSFHSFKKAQCNFFSSICENDEFLSARERRDMVTLLQNFGILYMWTDQHRGQNDKASKERFGYVPESWNCDQYQLVNAIKLDNEYTIKRFYSKFPQFNRTYTDENMYVRSKRSRLVFAMSSSINSPINLILSNFRKNFAKAFDSVYKCSCVEHADSNLKEYINKHYRGSNRQFDLFTFDITQYDNNIAPSTLYSYVKAFYDFNENLGYDIGMLAISPGSCKMPFAEPDPRVDRNRILNIGNAMDANSFGFGISPSGTADVSEKAKLIPTSFVIYEYMKLKHRLGLVSSDRKKFINEMECILRGMNPEIFFMNLGDNLCVVVDRRLEFRELLLESKIFKIDISDIGEFGGLLIKKVDDYGSADTCIEVIDSPISTLHKILSPERPIDDKMRSTYELGIIEKYTIAEGNSDIAVILDSIDRNMFNMFGASSQLDLAKRNIKRILADNARLDNTYREIALAATRSSVVSPSIFFMQILESGGDKLFYTDLYDSLSDREKEIIDDLFFTNIEEDVFGKIYKFYTK